MGGLRSLGSSFKTPKASGDRSERMKPRKTLRMKVQECSTGWQLGKKKYYTQLNDLMTYLNDYIQYKLTIEEKGDIIAIVLQIKIICVADFSSHYFKEISSLSKSVLQPYDLPLVLCIYCTHPYT